MKTIKHWWVKLYQHTQHPSLAAISSNWVSKKLIAEGYSKDKVTLPHRDGFIVLLTDPYDAEPITFRADVVDIIECIPVYEGEDEAKSDADEVKVKVHDHACVNCFAGKGPCLGDCHVTDVNRARSSSFEDVVKPVIKWLNESANSHASIIVDCTSAELLTGEIGVHTEEFLKD
ncbi:TPA: hypothetical protein RK230_003881 [Enterobacter asburiae]|nr:hypothetical protein [Enterobacter asburiae]